MPLVKNCVCLRLWNRLVSLDEDCITRTVFEVDYLNNGKWCKSVKKIFTDMDMSDVYFNKEECDMETCKQTLLSVFSQSWKKEIKKKPKLRTNFKFKNEHKTEKYVTLNLRSNERSVLAQLRTGTLPLQIEVGR